MPLGGPTHGVSGTSARVWTFAGREFDESRLELRVNGTPVELELKPLEVLLQLLQRSGEVVTKEELLEAVWPGLSVVDGSLSTAVYKLRKVLGDNDSRIITTVPRVGYRLDGALIKQTSPLSEPAETPHLAPGQPVPGREQWRLSRRLNASFKSDVWLAENPKTHEFRVFKFGDVDHLRSLKREVTVFRFLRQSLGERADFVRIFEWNFDASPYFIESEYGGLDLAEWARQGDLSRLSVEERAQVVASIADTVAVAHGVGVLHRDLKPANILMSAQPEGNSSFKLADFGSASLLEPSRLEALGITGLGLTQSGILPSPSLTGTLMYMAPEVLAGKRPTALSDVYSLGVILYQTIIGDFGKPLASGWEREIADPLLREDVAAAVCGDPSRRLLSAAELAQRLHTLEQRRVEQLRLQLAQRASYQSEQKRTAERARRPFWIALAITAILGVSASFYMQGRSRSPERPLRRVAVLPFQNAASDESLDFLSRAVPDEIATSLSYARGLSVRSYAAVDKYKQPDLDFQRTGRELKSDAVISGHFFKEGADLAVAVEAVSVPSGRPLWRDTLTIRTANMIELREKLAASTQGPLATVLGVSAFSLDNSTRPNSEEAYELYLRASAVPLDTPRNKQAIALLEKSVGIDANFAPAWLMLSRKYYVESRYGTGGTAMMERATAALRRAVALDPGYIPALAGMIGGFIEGGNLPKAVHDAEDLIRQHPQSADAHYILSYALRFAGLMEEAAKECDTAYRLDMHTQTSGLRSCAILFSLHGDYSRAKDYIDLDPTADFSQAILMSTLLRAGKEQEALRVGAPHMPGWLSFEMLPACAEHRPPQEIAMLVAKARISEDPEANYLSAANLAYCGQRKLAFEFLKKAIDGGYCSYPAMDTDPFFNQLRDAPEFRTLRKSGIACQRTFITSQERHLNQSDQ